MLLPIQILKTDFHIQKELVLDNFSLVVALQIRIPFLLSHVSKLLVENLVLFTPSQGLNP